MYSTSGIAMALRGGEGSAEPAVIVRRGQRDAEATRLGGWSFYCATRQVGAQTLVCIVRKGTR